MGFPRNAEQNSMFNRGKLFLCSQYAGIIITLSIPRFKEMKNILQCHEVVLLGFKSG